MPDTPALLVANILPETKSVLLVFGAYNFAVAKSFAQPVVGLMDEWVPEYASMFPFPQIERAEIIISRVIPEPTPGSTDTQPGAREAAAASANTDTNIRMLMSLLRSGWAHKHCILSRAGVFSKAQERFESRNFPTHRAKYYNLPTQKDFNKADTRGFIFLSDVRTSHVAALCAPPPIKQPVGIAPILQPRRTVCENTAHWDALPEEEKAKLLYEDSGRWMNVSTPCWGSPRRHEEVGIVIPPPLVDETVGTDGWKGTVTDEQRAALADDNWK